MRKLRLLFWRWAALELAASPRLVGWLLRRAQARPYEPLPGYMNRWWLVAPGSLLSRFLPLMRFHEILRPDTDRHPHDHPWAFRSLILRGHYTEERWFGDEDGWARFRLFHSAGDSYELPLGEYHRIAATSSEPVLTLCILGQKQDTWGFLVSGQRIQWETYFERKETPASLAGDADMTWAHALRGGGIAMCQLALNSEELNAMERAAGNQTFHDQFTVHALIKDARAAQGLAEEVRRLKAELDEVRTRLEVVANEATVSNLRLHHLRKPSAAMPSRR